MFYFLLKLNVHCVGSSAHHCHSSIQVVGASLIMRMWISGEDGSWSIKPLAVKWITYEIYPSLLLTTQWSKEAMWSHLMQRPEVQHSRRPQSEQPEIFGEVWHFQRGLKYSNSFSATSFNLSVPQFLSCIRVSRYRFIVQVACNIHAMGWVQGRLMVH